jgi:hypothetical protein
MSDSQRLVLTPRWANRHRLWELGIAGSFGTPVRGFWSILWAAVMIGFILQVALSNAWLGAVYGLAVLILGLAIFYAAHLIGPRIVVTADSIDRRRPLGGIVAIPVDECQGIHLFRLKTPWWYQPRKTAMFVAHDGGCLDRMSAFFWSADDFAEISRETGIPVVGGWDALLTSAQLARQIPSARSWSELNPFLAGVGLFAGLALFVALIVVLTPPSH